MPLVPALLFSLIVAVLVSLFGASATAQPEEERFSADNDKLQGDIDQDRG
jgi:hypothetical protein